MACGGLPRVGTEGEVVKREEGIVPPAMTHLVLCAPLASGYLRTPLPQP